MAGISNETHDQRNSDGDAVRTTLRYSQSTADRIAFHAGHQPTASFLRDLILDGLNRLEEPPEADNDSIPEDGVADVIDSVSRLAVQLDQLRQEVAKLATAVAGQQQQLQAVVGQAGAIKQLADAVTALLAQVEIEE